MTQAEKAARVAAAAAKKSREEGGGSSGSSAPAAAPAASPASSSTPKSSALKTPRSAASPALTPSHSSAGAGAAAPAFSLDRRDSVSVQGRERAGSGGGAGIKPKIKESATIKRQWAMERVDCSAVELPPLFAVPVASHRLHCFSLLLLTGPAPMLQFDDPKKVASFNRSAVVSRTAVGKVRAHTHTATRTPAGSLAHTDALAMPRHAYGRKKQRACEMKASGTVPSAKMREWRTPPLRAITQFLCTARAAFVRCTTGRPK